MIRSLAWLDAVPRLFVTKIGPKGSPAGHASSPSFAYSHDMRGAFVIQLGLESNPAAGRLEGWVEEVDTCIELRFSSTEELLKFMGLRVDLVRASTGKPAVSGVSKDEPGKKSFKKAKKLK